MEHPTQDPVSAGRPLTLEQQLQHAFAAVADRLRDELGRELQALSASAVAAAAAERDVAVESALARVRRDAEQHAEAQLRIAVSDAEGRARDAAKQAAEGERAKLEVRALEMAKAAAAASQHEMHVALVAASDRLMKAVHDLDRARSLTEILDVLVSASVHEAQRVGMWLVRGEELRGWRFVGCEPPPNPVLYIDAAGILAEAIRSGRALSSKTGTGRTPLAPKSAVHSIEADSLEATDVAGNALVGATEGSRSESAPRPSTGSESSVECAAVPIAIGGEIVAVLYADSGDVPRAAEAASGWPWPITLELLARHAARCLESMTALNAVRVLSGRSHHASTSGGRHASGDDTVDDRDAAARRYARLLVSEIKLYHETAVMDGRRQRDLSTRLSREIARARGLYEERISGGTGRAVDHFHDELVQTLAGGDASLLGQPS